MPYKIEYEHKLIPRSLDRRVKLSLEDREEIRRLYGNISQRKLAKMYGVSRRLIIFIGCPEKYKRNLIERAMRGGSMQYYNKKKSREASQKTRMYRKKLHKQKKLVEEK